MSTGLQTLAEHPIQAPTPMLIIQSLVDRGEDPTAMFNLAERWEANIAAEEYGKALAAFQGKCPQITKCRQIDLGGGKGPLYASYDDIDVIIRPIMAEFGLSKTFSATVTEAGQMRVICKIRHGRHVEENEVTLPVPAQMRVNDTQKMGAALQYGKRYAVCAALDLVVTDEDRDAANMFVGINEQQLATIEDWIALMGDKFKPRPFLKWLEIEKMSELPAEKYEMVVTELQSKAKALGFTK